MVDEIFVPSFGNRPQNLVGREDIISKFNDSLNSVPGSRERAMLLLGQRGTGKTVLLLEFAEIAKKKGIITASPTIVSNEMTDRIIEKLLLSANSVIGKKKKKVSGGSVSVLGFGAGLQLQDDSKNDKSFAQKLSEICNEANEKKHPVLILVDETQANNNELKKLIVAYQELVGSGVDVYIVLAGLPETISSVLNDHVLTFLNRATKIELPPLKKNDISAYYRNAFDKLKIEISEEDIENAALETSGSPYLMQLIGHYITVNADEDCRISKERIEKAIDSAKEDYKNDICRTAIASLSEKDYEFLVAMSEDEGDSSINDIATRLGKNSSYAQTYKRRLTHSGIIVKSERGRYRIAVPQLKEYLKEQ